MVRTAARARKEPPKKKPAQTDIGYRLTSGELLLPVCPIPGPLHGINLRSEQWGLGKVRWTKLRNAIVAKRGQRCETCDAETPQFEAHERWFYFVTGETAVAYVDGIELVCWYCHRCEHFPHTMIQFEKGRLNDAQFEAVILHYCEVNGATRLEFERHLEAAFREWERLSSIDKWGLDFGKYTNLVAEREAGKPLNIRRAHLT